MQPVWRIELFGGLRLQHGEQVITHFETRRAASLLACLACHRGRPFPRELLIELLWPEEDFEATRARFRQTLFIVRKVLEPEGLSPGSVVLTDRSDIQLAPQAFTTDVADFEAALKIADLATTREEKRGALLQAVGLYQGELLPGFYEEWFLQERARLAENYRDALNHLGATLAELGDLDGAIEYVRRAVQSDPLREDAHAGLIRLYVQAGRQAEALRQYRELEQILRAQLGATPSNSTRALLDAPASSPPAGAQPTAIVSSPAPLLPELEPEGGAVPPDSPFYIVRPTDAEFRAALKRRDSIVLVKGSRQIGKTSLLARGLREAHESGARVVVTDLQRLTNAQMADADTLFRTLAEEIVDQLELDVALDALWDPERGWNVNFERFLRREVLGNAETQLIWGLDEVDRLFGYPYRAEVFGLFRSWHNQRSLNLTDHWKRLTLAIAYATEAHLFITDLNQSPFNVGTRLTLEDFTRGEVEVMNRRYQSPLQNEAEVKRYHALVGGHPYLVRRGLHAMVTRGMDIAAVEAEAEHEGGLFGDHLQRMLNALRQDTGLCDAMRVLLRRGECPTPESFYRLHSAGLIVGTNAAEAGPRCRLYRTYLERHLL